MTNRIHLDDLRKGCSGILPSLGSFMCDCAIYLFASQGHLSGVNLEVETNDGNLDFVVTWEGGLSLEMERTMNDEERATDYGAMGMALLLVMYLTDYQHFTFARRGTGIDFTLYIKRPTVINQPPDARLEISGIKEASRTNTTTTRYKLKVEQVKQSDSMNVPVYIVITEFSTPKSLFI